MKEMFNFALSVLRKAAPTSFFDILVLFFCVVILILLTFSLTSCSLINRSSANGSRYVEKTVKQEQYWTIPSSGQPNQINTIETTKRTF